MSEIHLKDIRRSLERARWGVVEEQEGDDYRISAVWIVERPGGGSRFHLEFEGLGDTRTLPIEESYACSVREAEDVSCYFSRQGRSWPEELSKFEKRLREWHNTGNNAA